MTKSILYYSENSHKIPRTKNILNRIWSSKSIDMILPKKVGLGLYANYMDYFGCSMYMWVSVIKMLTLIGADRLFKFSVLQVIFFI